MKRFGALAVCLAWGLTACGGGAPTAEQPSAPPAAESTTEEPSIAEPSEEPSTEEPSEEPSTDETTQEPSPAGSPGETSDRGHIIIGAGDTFEVTGDNGDPIAEVTLTGISFDGECSSGFAEDAENGEFLFIEVEVKTLPALAEQEYLDDFSLSEYDMIALDSDGKRANDISGTSYTCLDSKDQLPYALGSGEIGTGSIVLDVPYDAGVVVYEPYYGTTDESFEFNF